MNRILPYVILLFTLIGCQTQKSLYSDEDATRSARKMYANLGKIASEGIMIGYEDALAYGIGWREAGGMCDMYRTTGEYPAIYGWDIGDIHKTANLDSVPFERMVNWIKEVHQMGGVNTISWHMDNPVNGASSWDKSDIGEDILPGGLHHDKLLERLDRAAILFKNCKLGDQYIPIIFRPFHEHNGDWFWWGKGNMSEDHYIELFRFVVNYFKKEHNIHHLIYAFSPDRSRIRNVMNKEEYLYAYPGDDYVDILGLDNYHDVVPNADDSLNQVSIHNFVMSLEVLTDIAEEKGKIAALTETGFEGIRAERWFTNRMLEPIMASEKAQRIAYIMLWRNANTVHHYMIYPEHPERDDFIRFLEEPRILTLKDISTRKSTKGNSGIIMK